MKPMIILAPNLMSDANIKELRDNGICVVVAKDPTKVRFMDPIPASSERTKMESAAISLSRQLLNWNFSSASYAWGKSDFAKMYMDILLKGSPLDANGSIEEQRERTYNLEKLDEIRRIAREDARAESARKKKESADTAAKVQKEKQTA